jgi:hypothetical protein
MAGCMSEGESYTDIVGGGFVHGDANGVTVKAPSQADTVARANGHCSHFKKAAQFDRKDAQGDFHYLCVAR